MANRKLRHTTGRSLEGNISVNWGSLQEILHDGRTVVFMQAHPGGSRNPYAVVPGYKVGKYKREGKSTSVNVETISHADQLAVRGKIQPIVEGIISFW
ncbi:MAG: hypothetical protein ACD_81C00131G0003 [uncultured bacterium]|uniref:Uncharacterized protein n=2 Tax=Candidatus Wolfeibacteriota TaxID=1752735 RepID=A0A0G1K514_9BACT|nr:MAG: hypothetical protein ACD_81C00131G0003 [uncultured bacterium]KKR12117.1 MAG: hypothetical protein UT41_C0003G0044 [Candidatus Wolfebacteria bacterium GW2011_GWC2_39_22]KKT42939.1 MAG: hypothetical protein UW32_C0003G0042 [Candidatus Wolfebacteria bacterium GW2011_GWE2_44_13]HBI25262.1 hypothetical protein [Candidatus Wolfebacteria bacterium]